MSIIAYYNSTYNNIINYNGPGRCSNNENYLYVN